MDDDEFSPEDYQRSLGHNPYAKPAAKRERPIFDDDDDDRPTRLNSFDEPRAVSRQQQPRGQHQYQDQQQQSRGQHQYQQPQSSQRRVANLVRRGPPPSHRQQQQMPVKRSDGGDSKDYIPGEDNDDDLRDYAQSMGANGDTEPPRIDATRAPLMPVVRIVFILITPFVFEKYLRYFRLRHPCSMVLNSL